jgi:hypothetical protein
MIKDLLRDSKMFPFVKDENIETQSIGTPKRWSGQLKKPELLLRLT